MCIQLGPRPDCCVALEASRLRRLPAGRPDVEVGSLFYSAAFHPSISNPTSALRVKTNFPSFRERKFTANLVQKSGSRQRYAQMQSKYLKNRRPCNQKISKTIKTHHFIGTIGEILTPYFEHSPMTPACDT